ncbi:MAG: hypothetical protein R3D98_10770 [Candidatus Krumholzibacteriia bacterium]
MNKSRVTLLVVALTLLALALLAGCRSAHTTSAILYIEQEQYQKAIDVIDEGLQFNPNDPEGFYYQGEAYSRMAQVATDENDYLGAKHAYENAYKKYVQARTMDPANWSERVAEALDINYTNAKREGLSNWRENHFEEAEGFFRLAFAALPDSVDAIKQIALMKIQQADIATGEGDDAKAKTFLTEALDLQNQVLADHPGKYKLLADKAYILTQLDRTDEAQAIYDQLMRDHGDDPELLLDVVGLYSKQSRYQDAGDLFMKVAGIYFNDSDPANDVKLKGMYSEAGYNYALAENYPKALEAYDRANEIDVNDASLMARRVQLNLLQGQTLARESAGLMVDDPAKAADLEAQSRAFLQRAVDVGNALVDIDPSNAEGYYYLADAQAALGDTAASLENRKTYNELMGNQ